MSKGRFGEFGGQYISETLMNELIRLEECYEYYKKDKEFQEELDRLLKEYAGRPSLLYYAEKMTKVWQQQRQRRSLAWNVRFSWVRRIRTDRR